MPFLPRVLVLFAPALVAPPPPAMLVVTPVMLFFSLRPSSLAGTLTSRLAFLVRLPVSVVVPPLSEDDCVCSRELLHGAEV